VTARGFQFHFHVVGYGVPSGRYRVLEAVIDTSGAAPTILYLRDITRLGLPFRIETNAETEGSGSESSGSEAMPAGNSESRAPKTETPPKTETKPKIQDRAPKSAGTERRK